MRVFSQSRPRTSQTTDPRNAPAEGNVRVHSRKTRPRKFPLEALEDRRLLSSGVHDVLDIGDAGDNSIKQFDAETGKYLGTLVAPGGGGLDGPRGLILRNPGQLFAANQNVDQTFSGEVLRYNANSGKALSSVVPSADPNAPFAPRGIVLKENVLYVANFEDNGGPSGEVTEYDANNGKFLRDLFPTNFPEQFNPRGVVFGPNGHLYVAANQQSDFGVNNPLGGFVVRFDTKTGASKVLASQDGVLGSTVVHDLHRPEGIVFSPDGKSLYVASFRADASDTDKILVLDPATGALKHEIILDQVGQPRAAAQAILFGPGGDLFVPITGTGAVRRYHVTDDTFSTFVAPADTGGPLGNPWYLTFEQTDPTTLAYHARPDNAGKSDEAISLTSNLDPTLTVPIVDQVPIDVHSLQAAGRRKHSEPFRQDS
jgi:DNA-binding beta-propeller fold protein YncE